MGLPKKRRSYMKQRLRRSHHALEKTNYVACQSCAAPTLPHRICPACGMYRGKQILELEAK